MRGQSRVAGQCGGWTSGGRKEVLVAFTGAPRRVVRWRPATRCLGAGLRWPSRPGRSKSAQARRFDPDELGILARERLRGEVQAAIAARVLLVVGGGGGGN